MLHRSGALEPPVRRWNCNAARGAGTHQCGAETVMLRGSGALEPTSGARDCCGLLLPTVYRLAPFSLGIYTRQLQDNYKTTSQDNPQDNSFFLAVVCIHENEDVSFISNSWAALV